MGEGCPKQAEGGPSGKCTGAAADRGAGVHAATRAARVAVAAGGPSTELASEPRLGAYERLGRDKGIGTEQAEVVLRVRQGVVAHVFDLGGRAQDASVVAIG